MSETENAQKSAPETEQKAPAIDSGGWVEYGEIGVRKGGPSQTSGNGNGDRKILPYLQLEEGRTYRIRLVGRPWRFFRHYDMVRAISPGFEKDPVWQSGKVPRERYSVLVLDKTQYEADKDPGMGVLKIFEGGPKIFKEFKAYKEMTKNKEFPEGKDPGGVNAPDWLIKVNIPAKMIDGRMKKDKRSTEYHVVRDDMTVLGAPEKEYIKANFVDLPKQNKPTEPELLNQMFEEAKTRGENDPVPGSKEWWKARRDKKKGESGETSTEERPLVPSEEAASSKTSSSKVEASDDSGFGGLFDEKSDDKGKPSTTF